MISQRFRPAARSPQPRQIPIAGPDWLSDHPVSQHAGPEALQPNTVVLLNSVNNKPKTVKGLLVLA